MALLPTFRPPTTGLNRLTWRQLFLLCVLLCVLMYVLRVIQLHGIKPILSPRYSSRGHGPSLQPTTTSWGASLVWGDNRASEQRREELKHKSFRVGLVVLAVGRYTHYLPRFLQTAETYFLPGFPVNYYILTDNQDKLIPPPTLAEGRDLRVVPVAEMPGWERLSHRRMDLLASTIDNQAQQEVDYVFCSDVDQVFAGPVGAEILGPLVATLHPQYYASPISALPYERSSDSRACVLDEEGDYYYTSELYGGSCAEVLALTKVCSLLILQDHSQGVEAQGLEESYLNRYLIDRKPTRVLSPEYSWWGSLATSTISKKRIVSLGRQCSSLRTQGEDDSNC